MAYQGEEEDISKLKVITRTDDESSKPEEGKIYIFNQNYVCIDTISPSALKECIIELPLKDIAKINLAVIFE